MFVLTCIALIYSNKRESSCTSTSWSYIRASCKVGFLLQLLIPANSCSQSSVPARLCTITLLQSSFRLIFAILTNEKTSQHKSSCDCHVMYSSVFFPVSFFYSQKTIRISNRSSKCLWLGESMHSQPLCTLRLLMSVPLHISVRLENYMKQISWLWTCFY